MDARLRPNPPCDQRAAARIADRLLRHRRLVLVAALGLAALAASRALRLELRTSLAELLPEQHPALITLRALTQRLNPPSRVVLAVESPSPEANRRFVDALKQRLEAAHLPEVLGVDTGIQQELEFFARNRFLYPSLDALNDAHARLQREILRRKNPTFVDLEAGDTSQDASTSDARLERLRARYPGGYYALPDRHTYAVVVHVAGALFRERSGEDIVARIAAVVRDLAPAHYHPALHVGYTGDLVHASEERHALESDLATASGVCIALVVLVIALFFGRLRDVVVAVVPALLGALLAFALAQLLGTALNASTAFLGSIIVGNGINYAIVQLARYHEERAHGYSVAQAVARSLAGTWRATLIAALGAALAYAALTATSFRGFNQFGWIGGAGMMFSWLATVLLVPALCGVIDHDPAPPAAPLHRWIHGFGPARDRVRGLLGVGARHPQAALALGAGLSVAALLPLRSYVADPFEYDFRKIGNQASRNQGAAALDATLDPLFGRTLSPSFLLAARPEDVQAIRRTLRARPGAAAVLGDIAVLDDWLPGTPEEQTAKLDVLARIRSLIDANTALLEPSERAALARLRPADDLHVLAARDLPASVRRYFTEADGTLGRVVVYFVRRDVSQWDGKVQLRLAELTDQVRLPDGQVVRGSGSAAVFAGMLAAIRSDGPRVTAIALGSVVVLVVMLAWRQRGAHLVLLGIGIGVLWMIGAAAAAGVRVNFLNFIALPITFGIGVDYAINIVLRARQAETTPEHAVQATGAAVGLCSLTTIIGYGALLCADNQGLRSLGALAILGEIACLCAALLILPALLQRRCQSLPHLPR